MDKQCASDLLDAALPWSNSLPWIYFRLFKYASLGKWLDMKRFHPPPSLCLCWTNSVAMPDKPVSRSSQLPA